MDASKSDVDFDSYWDEEARNPNRNRIRIGRQYQAQCPLLLKTGESDGRNLEELETLTWNPNNALNSHQLNEYFAIAKSIGLFIQAIDTCQDGIDEIECLEEEKCSLKPFEILDNGTKCVLEAKPDRPVNNNSNNNVISSPEKQSVTTRQRLQQQQQSKQPNVPQKSEEIDAACPSQPSSSSSATPPMISPLKQCSNTRIQSFAKGLPAFILAHHTPSLSSSEEHDKLCQFASTTAEQPINLGSTEKYNTKTLAKLLLGQWNESEAKVFAQAIKECGKNFSAIKKDYLPWKSVRSIIEFYYLTLDKEKERKRKLRKTEAKTNKHSPENNKKKKGQQSGQRQQQDNNDADNSSGSTQNKNDDGNDNKDSNNATNNDDDDDANDDDGNNSKQTDQPTPPPASSSPHDDEDKSEYCEQDSKDELLSSSKGIKNDNICLDLASTNSGNINGNNSYLLSPESKNSITPGQEVKPIKAKPILSQNETVENRSNIDSVNKTNLGSLNLYLNGELVLRLNAQQQESGQKWVESMDMPLRRKQLGTINNGFGSSRSAGIKRSFDSKSFKEDPDDVSLGGGDVSGSDDDSMTSNESSSLVASSPSSSSTITSAAKKVRVKVENSLNSLASVNGNNNPISSSPNSNGLKSDQSSPMFVNGSGCSKPSIGQAPQPIFDNLLELDFKKKLLEYYQMNMGMNSEEMQLLLTSALLVDPPKAHSNSISSLVANHNSNLNAINNNNNNNNNGISSFYSPVKETKLSKTDCLTPPKTISPASSLSSSPLSFMTNGYTNGFVSGPVDLTRKSPLLNHHHSNTGDTNNNHHSSVANSKNQSPSRHKLSSSSSSSSSLSSSSSFSLPRAAHESSRVSPSSHHHHHHRRSSSSSLAAVVGNNSSPFSLPAPPPMLSQSNNVPMSLSNNNKSSFATLNNNIHSRKSLSSIRGSSTSSSTHQESGIHQYAKL